MFKLKANVGELEVQETMTLTSGAQNVHRCRFSFEDGWDGLTRTAVFQAGEIMVQVLLGEDNECQIPWEVLEHPGMQVYAGVYGTRDGAVVLPTRIVELGRVYTGTTLGAEAQEPTPDIYSQILETARRAEEAVAQIQEDLQNGAYGVNGGAPGTSGAPGAPATLVSHAVEYQTAVSGVTPPTGGWSASVPDAAAGTYLWTRTTLTFNSGDPVVMYGVSRQGMDGSGSVSSVNGVSPDADGNVALSASDVGAATEAYVDQAVSEVAIETDPTLSVAGAAADAKAAGDRMATFARPNLLDNWYFGNPVNQYGTSGTISTAGYFLDRWKLVSGTVEITSSGLVLNGVMEQILEFAIGQPVKASVLTSDGILPAGYDDSVRKLTITAAGQTIVAVKLELGDTQTLAHQEENGNWVLNEIPDYRQQLAKCQRYYVKLSPNSNYAAWFPATAIGSNAIVCPVYLPVPIRTKPTVTMSGSLIAQNTVQTLYDLASRAVVVQGLSDNLVGLNFAVSGATQEVYTVRSNNDPAAYILFNANL